MKKTISILLCTLLILTISACQKTNENLDEMKIPYTVDLDSEYGADSVEREGDHFDSPYYKTPDFYNMKSTDTLTILTHFKTQQQTSEWSCGVSSALMILDWYGRRGEHNEETLAQYRSNGLAPEATSMSQLIDIFEGVGGFDLYSVFDCQDNVYEIFTLEFIQETLKEGHPIAIGWNDWGGHWQVIIGYDTMGTEIEQDDVIIVADSYDTTDHNQDGYGIYSAERFIYNFTFYNFFDEESNEPNDMCFLVVKPQ
ncbi:MAG: papain-like cysteine protease family protein [Traorella sp.]